VLAPWIDNPGHRAWLSAETGRLLDFCLAACTAAQAGFDTADLIAEVTALLGTRFLEPSQNLYMEGWSRDWTVSEDHRGQNPSMHLVEAFMAAFEATGDRSYLDRARPIADRIIGEFAAAGGWRIPEH
jgi:mannose/cellobiose epimerase-like protein (N-acyl-D-glucosamine 2-epimerase family)